MQLKPRGDWVIGETVKPNPEMKKGLVMPESMMANLENRPMMRVVAIGPDVNKPPHHPEAYKPSGPPIEEGKVYTFDRNEARPVPGQDTKTVIQVPMQAIIAEVESDEMCDPEALREAQNRVERIKAEQGKQRSAGPGLVVPVGAAPAARTMKLVEGAGR